MQSLTAFLLLLSLSATIDAGVVLKNDQLFYSHQELMSSRNCASFCASMGAVVPHDLEYDDIDSFRVLIDSYGFSGSNLWLNVTQGADQLYRWGISEKVVDERLWADQWHHPTIDCPNEYSKVCGVVLSKDGLYTESVLHRLAPFCVFKISERSYRARLLSHLHQLNAQDMPLIASWLWKYEMKTQGYAGEAVSKFLKEFLPLIPDTNSLESRVRRLERRLQEIQ